MHPTPPPDVQAARAAFYGRIRQQHMAPLWEVLGALVPPQPASPAQPAHWRYATLRDQVLPPTLNLHTIDPAIDLDVVAGQARPGNYEYALNNSFGFGGHNVALAFGKY